MMTDYNLRVLITVKDIQKSTIIQWPTKIAWGRFTLAGAAVGVGVGTEKRVELLLKQGLTSLSLIRGARPFLNVLDRVNWIKKIIRN